MNIYRKIGLILAIIFIFQSNAYSADCDTVNVLGEDGNTDLARAMAFDEKQLVKKLMECHPDYNLRIELGWNLIHIAAYYNYVDVIETLIQRGDNINKPAEVGGWTPLMMAVRAGKPAIPAIKLLIKMGADKSLKDSAGNTAYQEALGNEDLKSVLNILKP